MIVNATFTTFPTFNATKSTIILSAADSTAVGALAEANARHVFDWDSINAGQALSILHSGVGTIYTVVVSSYFPRATADEAIAALAPLVADFRLVGVSLLSNTTSTTTINTVLAQADDQTGGYGLVGSRLIPASSYETPEKIGNVFKQLIDAGTIGYVLDILFFFFAKMLKIFLPEFFQITLREAKFPRTPTSRAQLTQLGGQRKLM